MNITNINILLNHTDLRPIRHDLRDYNVFVHRFSGQPTHNPRHVFVGYFYSNLTGDLCYVHQKDDEVYAKCFDSCMSTGLADNISTTAGYKYGSVNLTDYEIVTCTSNDTDMVIQTLQAAYYGADWQIYAFTDFDSTGVEVDSFMFTGGGSSGGYRYYRNGIWQTVVIANEAAMSACGSYPDCRCVAVYPFCYCNPGDNDCLVGPTTGITQIKGYHSVTLPHRLYETTPIISPISSADHEDMFCCTNNLDCVSEYGEEWCCNNAHYICYPCGTGTGDIELIITSIPSTVAINKKICNNTAATLYVELRENDVRRSPSGTITVSITGGGTINGKTTDSCDSEDMPCEFQYTSRATTGTDFIKFTYSGNNEYSGVATQANIQVSENCHWIMFLTYDHEDYTSIPRVYTPLYGTTITSDTGVTKTTIPQFFMARTAAMAKFDSLSKTEYTFTFSKEGYETVTYNLSSTDLDKFWVITLKPDIPEYTESWALEDNIPNNTFDAIRGFKELSLSATGNLFTWVWLFILLLFFFAILIGVVKSVT